MADVPGSPDPKGFQFGEGGKVLLEPIVEGVQKIGTSAMEAIRQHRKNVAEHNKNVSMEQWRMQAKHQMKMERNQQKHGFNLQSQVLDIAGNVVGIKTKGSETRKTAGVAVRGATKLLDAGATETKVNAKKGKVTASKPPTAAPRRASANSSAPAKSAAKPAKPVAPKPVAPKTSVKTGGAAKPPSSRARAPKPTSMK